jgi:adenosylmethionine-8-amino-7-oxononanoate aminotransferase
MTKLSADSNDLIDFDGAHIWHPYSSMIDRMPMLPVDSAAGARIHLTDGRELIDGMSSWWSAIHGYNHPVLNAAVREQVAKMSHIMFGGLTHEPAVTLARQLVAVTPQQLQTVFFSDSGSVSVEVAIKMALQYWQAVGQSQKTRLLTVRNGYHGDTFAAMSVCDPVNGMHQLFSNVLPLQLFADAPQCGFSQRWHEDDVHSFQRLINQHHREIAAVILEPIVQGAGGMRMYSPEYLRCVRQLCDKYDVLLILDEIATGFGRTGEYFASEHAGVCPDIMCVGKALTGGYLSLAATLTTRRVSDGISQHGRGTFMHGPTFMANPTACAVASANLELLGSGAWREQVSCIQSVLQQDLEPFRAIPAVNDVRVLGAIGVIELHEPVDLRVVQPALVEQGVWLRPYGRLLYTMPPFVIEPGDLRQITAAMRKVVGQVN